MQAAPKVWERILLWRPWLQRFNLTASRLCVDRNPAQTFLLTDPAASLVTVRRMAEAPQVTAAQEGQCRA